jgi:hypothetical protein
LKDSYFVELSKRWVVSLKGRGVIDENFKKRIRAFIGESNLSQSSVLDHLQKLLEVLKQKLVTLLDAITRLSSITTK